MSTTFTPQAIRRNQFPSVPFTSSGGNNPGDVVAVSGARVGIVAGLEAVADGDAGAADVSGQFDLLKNATSDTYAVDDDVWWDPTAHKAKTTFSSGYLYAGRCVKDSANGDAYVYTDLNVKLADYVAPLTDSTGGTPAASLVIVRSDTGAHTAADCIANFASLNAQVNALAAAIQNAGMQASS